MSRYSKDPLRSGRNAWKMALQQLDAIVTADRSDGLGSLMRASWLDRLMDDTQIGHLANLAHIPNESGGRKREARSLLSQHPSAHPRVMRAFAELYAEGILAVARRDAEPGSDPYRVARDRLFARIARTNAGHLFHLLNSAGTEHVARFALGKENGSSAEVLDGDGRVVAQMKRRSRDQSTGPVRLGEGPVVLAMTDFGAFGTSPNGRRAFDIIATIPLVIRIKDTGGRFLDEIGSKPAPQPV